MSLVILELTFPLPNGDTVYVYRSYNGNRISVVIDKDGITRAVGV